ncbi:hypothetical protein LUCX_258 [Xanthomonas phage vB_XciM_LucasX]|nr:hypothetical protein LUCX_258 [Xanthomonas phage vB_XciM_LucasX]
MKVIRVWSTGIWSNRRYRLAFIRANFFERRAIRKKIAAAGPRRLHIIDAPHGAGMKVHGATFLLSARHRPTPR